jgi:hypothetical protein
MLAIGQGRDRNNNMKELAAREQGQVIIWSLLTMTVIFVVGAITIDIGLFLSERRGSQTDADFSALSGALELIDPAADAGDAMTAADSNLDANDEQGNIDWPNTSIVVDDSCWDEAGDDDAVTVDVSHSSKALFFGIFGLLAPEIGAHAKACVGAAQGLGNLIPIQIDDNPGPCFDDEEEPKFTSMCPIELGSQGSNPDRGMADLDASGDYCSEAGGAGDIEELIEFGATGICLINTSGSCNPASNGPWYECIATQAGNAKKALAGINARVLKDGKCDQSFGDGDHTDEFSETVEMVFNSGDPFTSIYGSRDCDPSQDGTQASPRLVTIIVLEEPPNPQPSNEGLPIIAFAGFYIAGCAAEDDVVVDESDLDPNCYYPGGPVPTPPPAPTPVPVDDCGAPAHCVVYGRFVKLIVAGSDVGKPTDQTTLFGISLDE